MPPLLSGLLGLPLALCCRRASARENAALFAEKRLLRCRLPWDNDGQAGGPAGRRTIRRMGSAGFRIDWGR